MPSSDLAYKALYTALETKSRAYQRDPASPQLHDDIFVETNGSTSSIVYMFIARSTTTLLGSREPHIQRCGVFANVDKRAATARASAINPRGRDHSSVLPALALFPTSAAIRHRRTTKVITSLRLDVTVSRGCFTPAARSGQARGAIADRRAAMRPPGLRAPAARRNPGCSARLRAASSLRATAKNSASFHARGIHHRRLHRHRRMRCCFANAAGTAAQRRSSAVSSGGVPSAEPFACRACGRLVQRDVARTRDHPGLRPREAPDAEHGSPAASCRARSRRGAQQSGRRGGGAIGGWADQRDGRPVVFAAGTAGTPCAAIVTHLSVSSSHAT
jgi:hypothetical protein